MDIFQLNNKNYLCIVDYHSKFLVIKKMEVLSAENLIAAVKIIFADYGVLHRLMSNAGSNFVSEKFRSFYSSVNIAEAVSLLYHYHSNKQVEACLKFIKHTIKKYSDSSGDVHMALLQIRTTPLGQGLASPATLLFNHPVCCIMPVIDRKPVSVDNGDEHHKKLTHSQDKNDPNNDAS